MRIQPRINDEVNEVRAFFSFLSAWIYPRLTHVFWSRNGSTTRLATQTMDFGFSD